MLPKGEYRGGLYDIGFDKPEAHAIAKDGAMYYAFYAKKWNGQVQLRGLERRALSRARPVQRTSISARSTRSPTTVNARFERFLLLKRAETRMSERHAAGWSTRWSPSSCGASGARSPACRRNTDSRTRWCTASGR